MATTEEIVAKYRLDLDELKTQVTELEKTYGRADDAAKKSAENADKSFNKLGDSLKDLGKKVIAAFAVERIIAFGKASVQAYAEAEKGAQKLRAAVGATGGLEKDFKALTEQAEQLAKITIFDDDQVKAAQTLALQFGLNSAAVTKLIPKVADFAAATGQDLSAALQAVLGGINGQVDGLKRFGIQLDTTASRNERFGVVVDQLTAKFNGQAEALTQTLGGSITQAEKAFGELQETVGEALAPAVTAAAEAVTALFTTLQGTPQDPLVDEVAALETYRAKLFDVNTTAEERGKLIDELKLKYPEYLTFLDKDKTTNAQLSEALNLVTNELVDQLVIRQQTAKVEEKQAAVNEARTKVAEKEAAVAELLIKARQQGVVVEDKYVSLTDRAARAVELLGKKQEGAGIGTRAILGQLIQDLNKAAKGQGTFSDGLVQALQKEQKANQDLATQQKTRTDVLQELGLSAQNYSKIEQDALDALIAKGDKLAQAEDERRKKAAAAAAKAGPGLGETDAERTARLAREAAAKKEREAAAKAKADQAAKDAADQVKQEQDANAQVLQVVEQSITEESQMRQRAIDARFDQQVNGAQAAALEEQAILLQQLQAGLITYEQYEKQKADIAKRIPDVSKERQIATLENEAETLRQQVNLAAVGSAERSKLENDLANKQAELERQKTALQVSEEEKRIASAEEEAKAKADLLAQQQEQQRKNNEATMMSIDKLYQGINALVAVDIDNQIKALEDQNKIQGEQYTAEQANLEEQYNRRLISQAVYEQRSAELKQKRITSEQDIDKKMKELKQRQDRAAKLQAIYRIGIDTAAAITAQLKETPLPAGAFFVAAIAASGLLQLKAVTAAAPPQYAEGVDWVPLGRNKRGRDTIPAMLDEGERVVSRRKNLRHWELYQAIDEDRLPQYIWKQYTAPALERERASGGAVVRALSGVLQGTPSQSAAGGSAEELRRLWRRGLIINNLDELAALIRRHEPSPYRN